MFMVLGSMNGQHQAGASSFETIVQTCLAVMGFAGAAATGLVLVTLVKRSR